MSKEKIDYENMAVDELTALYKRKIIGELKIIDEKNAKPENQPSDHLGVGGTETKFPSTLDSRVIKLWTKYENKSGKKFNTYESGKTLFENSDADDGCSADVSSWSPADVYSTIIWNTAVCKTNLLGIAIKGLEIDAGDGLGVQIRAFGAFPDPEELDACECGSCSSLTFKTYPLTIKQYHLGGVVCNLDVFDVGNGLIDSYISSMSDSFSAFIDYNIYTQLETASAGYTETLPASLSCSPSIAGSCCTDSSLINLYNAVHAVVEAGAEGRYPKGYDTIIVSPSVAGIFSRMQMPSPLYWMSDVKTDSKGDLAEIAGLKVISYCRANSCTDASGEVVAIIINSQRAVGAVFGEKPRLYKEFNQTCNSYSLDMWAFIAFSECDLDAIAFIKNPA